MTRNWCIDPRYKSKLIQDTGTRNLLIASRDGDQTERKSLGIECRT